MRWRGQWQRAQVLDSDHGSRSHSTTTGCVATLRLSMPSCKGPTGQISAWVPCPGGTRSRGRA